MSSTARERLVLPLDVPDLGAAKTLIATLGAEVGVFKVGLQLFVAEGPAAVKAVHDAGGICFLDLKLHDIPATVAHAVEAASRLDVRYLTVHTACGPSALKTAAETAEGTGMQLLGVTVLTSLDGGSLSAVGVDIPAGTAVLRRAQLAADCGLSGLVCSPRETELLRHELGDDMLLVVPGIRPTGTSADDQSRTATPREAIAAGADLIVVGRPIRHAADPASAARTVCAEIAAGLAARA